MGRGTQLGKAGCPSGRQTTLGLGELGGLKGYINMVGVVRRRETGGTWDKGCMGKRRTIGVGTTYYPESDATLICREVRHVVPALISFPRRILWKSSDILDSTLVTFIAPARELQWGLDEAEAARAKT